ncbi:hypothetical protein HS088_TW14G00108 [Tripterygium wilfordii]|uniref:Uncharacterized protein n=1 Tax=Tripterygium wilfordii TaxID=458696 RepID=A0A7J7CPP1_TRIWF|nr:hypothetical protein HS088_TW14G00108 [Tripterygium wilfordii]
MPSHSTVTNESLGVSQIDTLDPQKRSDGHPSPNTEVQGDAKPSDASFNQWEVGADVKHNPVPSTSEVSKGTILGSTSSCWGGQAQGNANVGLGISQGTGYQTMMRTQPLLLGMQAVVITSQVMPQSDCPAKETTTIFITWIQYLVRLRIFGTGRQHTVV